MKKLFSLALLLLMGVTFCMAQDNTKQTAVKEAKFNELKHHFGDIEQGKPATTKFNFKNTGNKPLIIETAVASCGCTTPTYPKQPVLPGKSADITVTFNAEANGAFSKMVTVKFAGYDRPVLLTIDGTVK